MCYGQILWPPIYFLTWAGSCKQHYVFLLWTDLMQKSLLGVLKSLAAVTWSKCDRLNQPGWLLAALEYGQNYLLTYSCLMHYQRASEHVYCVWSAAPSQAQPTQSQLITLKPSQTRVTKQAPYARESLSTSLMEVRGVAIEGIYIYIPSQNQVK